MSERELRERLKLLRIKLDEPFSYRGKEPAVIERVDAIRRKIDDMLAEASQRSETGTREPGQQVSVGSVARPAGLMTPALTDQIRQLREALRWIAAAASGEEQVESCADDTDVLAHIAKYAELAESETPAPRELERTAGDVIREFRESGSQDWGQLESAVNWWAMTDFCPRFTGERK